MVEGSVSNGKLSRISAPALNYKWHNSVAPTQRWVHLHVQYNTQYCKSQWCTTTGYHWMLLIKDGKREREKKKAVLQVHIALKHKISQWTMFMICTARWMIFFSSFLFFCCQSNLVVCLSLKSSSSSFNALEQWKNSNIYREMTDSGQEVIIMYELSATASN